MRRICAFLILSTVKILSHLFYQGEFKYLTPAPDFRQIRMLVFLNHTSLYEPLFVAALPFSFLWAIAGHISLPGADSTLDRPIVGFFWKLMIPRITTITRKRDETWTNYLESIDPLNDIVFIAPEGRMKRPNGLDKDGKPMSVRAGVVEVLEKMNQGHILFCLSGGLHHVQAPGQRFPKVFKKIKANVDFMEIKKYKNQFASLSDKERTSAIINDLQSRIEKDCPK